jgi:response regulator RpfG family c-di-GMP phosphodiesterase
MEARKMAEKTVNYTPEMTAELVEAYQAADSEESREAVIVEKAEKFGKNTKSIRAKLVRCQVYVKKEYKTKTGAPTERKAAIVSDIAATLGVSVEVVESLEKATKPALNLLRGTLKRAAKES